MGLSVGLTGGIASGKTTVLEMLRQRGARTISADAVVHTLLAECAPLKQAIRREFGDSVMLAGGGVDRGALGRLVFSDESLRRRLEALIHPLVHQHINAWLDEDAGRANINVAEIPLLFETESNYHFDVTIVVWTEQRLQLHRLQKKALGADEIQARIASQMPLDEKASRADFVVRNVGNLSELSRQVEKLWVFLTKRLAGQDR